MQDTNRATLLARHVTLSRPQHVCHMHRTARTHLHSDGGTHRQQTGDLQPVDSGGLCDHVTALLRWHNEVHVEAFKFAAVKCGGAIVDDESLLPFEPQQGP